MYTIQITCFELMMHRILWIIIPITSCLRSFFQNQIFDPYSTC